MSDGGGAGAPRAALADTVALVRRYVVQETIGPFKTIAKRAALGAAGVILLGVGLVVCLIALLRVLQGETGTTFAGSWTFAPYLLVAVAGVLLTGAAVVIGLRAGRSPARRVRAEVQR
ncbi:MAG: hypothetical protein JWM85_2290 [Acidimicrobiaceae bacterium]|nr:hypothetical protein [Acidimicrobiaceae bacterium]